MFCSMYNAYLMNWAQFYNKKGINKNGIELNSRNGASSNRFYGFWIPVHFLLEGLNGHTLTHTH